MNHALQGHPELGLPAQCDALCRTDVGTFAALAGGELTAERALRRGLVEARAGAGDEPVLPLLESLAAALRGNTRPAAHSRPTQTV